MNRRQYIHAKSILKAVDLAVTALLMIGMALLMLGAIWFVPIWRVEAVKQAANKPRPSARIEQQKPVPAEPSAVDYLQQETALRAVLAQIVAGMLIAFGAWVSWRQLHISREGQITDRFTKAITQLGSEQLEIRLGGIYALERIARDSLSDHWNVMEVLTTYVRENSPWPPRDGVAIAFSEYQPASEQNFKAGQADDGQDETPPHRPKADIQAIMTVIGRRSASQRRHEREHGYRLDLRRVDLHGVDMHKAHLEGAKLVEAHLGGADLWGAHLEGSILRGAHLEGSILRGAHLECAGLGDAHLEGANLGEAHLEGADLWGAHLEGVNLREAHLEGANLWGATGLTVEQLQWVHLNDETGFPGYIGCAEFEKTNVYQRAARGEIKVDEAGYPMLDDDDNPIPVDSPTTE